MVDPQRVYVFRSGVVGAGPDTAMCAAPADLVATVYGGGGHCDQDGLRRVFGGNAFFRDESTGTCFLGVWGTRNVARFRAALRRHGALVLVGAPPPARLLWWGTSGSRPHTSRSAADA